MAKKKVQNDTDAIFIGVIAFLIAIFFLWLSGFSLDISDINFILIGLPLVIGIAMFAKGFNLVK